MEPTLRTVFVTALLAGIASGLAVVLTERTLFPSPHLARLDLAAVIMEEVTDPHAASLSGEERSRNAARFVERLDVEVARLSRDYHAVLLAAPAVVSGLPDLTPILRARLGMRPAHDPAKR